MNQTRAFRLAETDSDHLAETALDLAIEGGMRLDAIHDQDGVCLGCFLINPHRNAVRSGAYLHYFHRGFDFAPHALRRIAEFRQERSLALRPGATMTTHRRHDEGAQAPLFKPVNGGRDHQGHTPNAAAAAGNGDAAARRQLFEAVRTLEHGAGGRCDIVERWRDGVMQFRRHHLGQRFIGELRQVNSWENRPVGFAHINLGPDAPQPLRRAGTESRTSWSRQRARCYRSGRTAARPRRHRRRLD